MTASESRAALDTSWEDIMDLEPLVSISQTTELNDQDVIHVRDTPILPFDDHSVTD